MKIKYSIDCPSSKKEGKMITMDPQVARIVEEYREAARKGINIPRPSKQAEAPPPQPQELPPCACSGSIIPAEEEIRTALAAIRSIAKLCPFVRNARVALSFWGIRSLRIPGYGGTLPIDALAERVIYLVNQSPHFSEAERRHGKRIAPLINRIYKLSDEQIAGSSFITRFCVFFRDLSLGISRFLGRQPLSIRHRWENSSVYIDKHKYESIFNLYTQQQYIATFGSNRISQASRIYGPRDMLYYSPNARPEEEDPFPRKKVC